MKTTLKNRIAQSQEILLKGDFEHHMHSNDIIVVYEASVMCGSRVNSRYNKILMGRNAVPRWWHSASILVDCKINSSFKKAYAEVVDYIKQEYDITPGRILKLLDILYCGQPKYSTERNIRAEKEKLRRYLRKLNDLRIYCKEMTESEIYDFSFDMAFDFIDLLSLSKATLSLSLMIMYLIQRECNLLPLPLICKDKEEFKDRLEPKSDDWLSKRNTKKEFRLFMRKLLDLHLRLFIKNATKDNAIKPSSRDRILELIKNNPTHTAKTMATIMELSVQAIQKQIRKLKDEGRLERIGPDRGGKWKVIDK